MKENLGAKALAIIIILNFVSFMIFEILTTTNGVTFTYSNGYYGLIHHDFGWSAAWRYGILIPLVFQLLIPVVFSGYTLFFWRRQNKTSKILLLATYVIIFILIYFFMNIINNPIDTIRGNQAGLSRIITIL